VENAASLFGLAAMLLAFGFVIRSGVTAWLHIKEFDRNARASESSIEDSTELSDRLARIEQIVETTAVEVERLAEGQRYAMRLLAEPRLAPRASSHEQAKVITPH
jgi:hypothetical protein